MTSVVVSVVVHVFSGCIKHEQPHTPFGHHGEGPALLGQVRAKIEAIRIVNDDASNSLAVWRDVHSDLGCPISKVGVLHKIGQPFVDRQLHELNLVLIERWRENAAVFPMVKQGMNLVNDAFKVSEMLACRLHVAIRKQSK